MPSRKILVQEDFLHLENLGSPISGYLSFYAKSDNNFYKRNSEGTESILWDSSNHGHGSGMDADMLDGQHLSYFAPSNHAHSQYVLKSGDTMTGNLLIAKTTPTEYDTSGITLRAVTSSTNATEALLSAVNQQDSGGILLRIARDMPGSHTHYTIINASFLYNTVQGSRLDIGNPAFENISIYADPDIVANAASVYVTDNAGFVKRVPISSFNTGGIGYGLTSVGLSMPANLFNVIGSPLTANGTIQVQLHDQAANSFFAGPTNAAGAPGFRALVAADIPDISYLYDNYNGWILGIDNTTSQLIRSSLVSDGIEFISGTGISISTYHAPGCALAIEFSATAGGGGVNYLYNTYLTGNQSTIPANTWTDVPGVEYALTGVGVYAVFAHVTIVKNSTTGAVVAARLITDAGQVIGSAEQYCSSTSTNRVSLSIFGTVSLKDVATIMLQIWASTTGWYAVGTTPSSNSSNATEIMAIKIM